MDQSNRDLARQFFRLIEANDIGAVRALCAPEMTFWQNTGGGGDLDGLLAFTASVRAAVSAFGYENPIPKATEDGFVEEHDVCFTLLDGTVIRLVACVVATIKGGLIASLREYVDSAQAAALVKALAPRPS